MSSLTTAKQELVYRSAELLLFRLSTKFCTVPDKKVT